MNKNDIAKQTAPESLDAKQNLADEGKLPLEHRAQDKKIKKLEKRVEKVERAVIKLSSFKKGEESANQKWHKTLNIVTHIIVDLAGAAAGFLLKLFT